MVTLFYHLKSSQHPAHAHLFVLKRPGLPRLRGPLLTRTRRMDRVNGEGLGYEASAYQVVANEEPPSRQPPRVGVAPPDTMPRQKQFLWGNDAGSTLTANNNCYVECSLSMTVSSVLTPEHHRLHFPSSEAVSQFFFASCRDIIWSDLLSLRFRFSGFCIFSIYTHTTQVFNLGVVA